MSGSSSVASSDPNTMLVQLCVKALASVAPEGMTTKELAAALDKEVKGTPGFDGISSSILSSKLNAIFRRCHGDSVAPSRAQLVELPMTRSQSMEIPRRLVYKYTPADSAELPEAPSTPVEDNSSGDESLELNEPLTPKEEAGAGRGEFSHSAKKRRVMSTTRKEDSPYRTEPGTPPEIVTKSEDVEKQIPIAESSKQTLPEATPRPPTPIEPQSQNTITDQQRTKRPAFSLSRPRGPNLYYDAVGLDAMSAALKLKHPKAPEDTKESESDADALRDPDWSDFPSPELLGLNELDGFVC